MNHSQLLALSSCLQMAERVWRWPWIQNKHTSQDMDIEEEHAVFFYNVHDNTGGRHGRRRRRRRRKWLLFCVLFPPPPRRITQMHQTSGRDFGYNGFWEGSDFQHSRTVLGVRGVWRKSNLLYLIVFMRFLFFFSTTYIHSGGK